MSTTASSVSRKSNIDRTPASRQTKQLRPDSSQGGNIEQKAESKAESTSTIDFSLAAVVHYAKPFDETIREAMLKSFHKLRKDCGYADVSTIERLIIDQVALCSLRLNILQLYHAMASEKGPTLSVMSRWDRRLSAGQIQLIRAAESLTRIRRMLKRPEVQIMVQALAMVGESTQIDDSTQHEIERQRLRLVNQRGDVAEGRTMDQ